MNQTSKLYSMLHNWSRKIVETEKTGVKAAYGQQEVQ